MADYLLRVLILFGGIPFVYGNPWALPLPTVAPKPEEVWGHGWSPKPTRPPMPKANLPVHNRATFFYDEMLKRQQDTENPATATVPDPCGYRFGYELLSLTCDVGYLCATETDISAYGCCTVTGGTQCDFLTGCVPYTSSCDLSCQQDVSITYCGDHHYPYCVTHFLVSSTSTFTGYSCDYIPGVSEDLVSIHATAFSPTIGDDSTTTSSLTSSPTMSSASSTVPATITVTMTPSAQSNGNSDGGNGDSTNVGAIAGGVVGGLAVIAAFGLLAYFMIKRRKHAYAPTPTQAPPMAQQPQPGYAPSPGQGPQGGYVAGYYNYATPGQSHSPQHPLPSHSPPTSYGSPPAGSRSPDAEGLQPYSYASGGHNPANSQSPERINSPGAEGLQPYSYATGTYNAYNPGNGQNDVSQHSSYSNTGLLGNPTGTQATQSTPFRDYSSPASPAPIMSATGGLGLHEMDPNRNQR